MLCILAWTIVAATAPPLDRVAFAAALRGVKMDMSGDQVKALLGQPDDVITEADPPPHCDWRGGEIWNYGTDRHLGFPTLGSVTFTRKGSVEDWHGTKARDKTLLPEPRLRTLLRLLADTGPIPKPAIGAFAQTDPLATIRMAMALQPLGKKAILDLLKEFCDVAELGAAYYYPVHTTLLGMLFDVDRAKRPLLDGEWELPAVATTVGNLPLPWDNPVFGRPPTVTPHLALYRRAGILKRPWIPPADPMTLPERIWKTGMLKNREELEPIYKSIRLMLRNCIPLDASDLTERTMNSDTWNSFVARIKNRKVVWDSRARCYAFEGVNPVPDRRFGAVTRLLWQPKELAEHDFRVTIDRHLAGATEITERKSPETSWDSQISIQQILPEQRVFKLSKIPREESSGVFSLDKEYSFTDFKARAWEYVRDGAVSFRVIVETGGQRITSPEFKLPRL